MSYPRSEDPGIAQHDVRAEQAAAATTRQASSEDPRTVEELKEELKARDLPTSGSKAELLERLQSA